MTTIYFFQKPLIYAVQFSPAVPLKEEMFWIKLFQVKSKRGHICMEKGNIDQFSTFSRISYISITTFTGNFLTVYHHYPHKSHDIFLLRGKRMKNVIFGFHSVLF